METNMCGQMPAQSHPMSQTAVTSTQPSITTGMSPWAMCASIIKSAWVDDIDFARHSESMQSELEQKEKRF